MCIASRIRNQKEAFFMTDTMLLLSCMKCKRITLGYAAEVLGISSSTLRYKINNDRDFKVSEVDKLCHLLGLNRDQRDLYFFRHVS